MKLQEIQYPNCGSQDYDITLSPATNIVNVSLPIVPKCLVQTFCLYKRKPLKRKLKLNVYLIRPNQFEFYLQVLKKKTHINVIANDNARVVDLNK